MRDNMFKPRAISIITIILIIAMLFSFTACSSDDKSGGGKTKEITDCLGRTVEIPVNPQRVAALFASIAHMMAMLDEGDKIEGIMGGVKSDELMLMKYPEIANTPTPSQESSINIEELAGLDVDLALIRYSMARNDGEVEKLDKLGIPYVVVDYENIDELKKAVEVMGQVFNNEDRAAEYIKFFDDTVNLVNERIGEVDEANYPQVYHSVNEAIRTNSDGDISVEVMHLAGTKSASEGKKLTSEGDKQFATLEEIYKWNPSAIIANEFAVTDYILTDSKWEGLDAVKQKKVYTLPVGATRWGHPGSMEPHMAVLFIAKQFYPEEMKDIDLNDYTQKYYKEQFDLDLDDATISKILAGKGMRKSNKPERN